MRRVRSASWTSRPASCFMSSGSRWSPRISWLKAMIAASGLFSSWATPETSRPIASIFWACSSSLVRRSWSDRSRTSVQEAALAAQLDDPNLDLDRELRAVGPAAAIAERAPALGPDYLPAAGHLALVGGDRAGRSSGPGPRRG